MRKIFTFLVLLLYTYSSLAQEPGLSVEAAFNGVFENQAPNNELDFYTNENGCYNYSEYGSGEFTVGAALNFSVSGLANLANFAYNPTLAGAIGTINTFVVPTLTCTYDLVNYQGYIASKSLNASSQYQHINEINNKLNYIDVIEVYSPLTEPTIIELPFQISGALNAIDFFCIPSDSSTFASIELTATFGGQTLTLNDFTNTLDGWVGNRPNSKAVVQVIAYPGSNQYNLSVNGSLSVKATAIGVSPLNILTCGSTSYADINIRVSNFTGANGGPIPSGVSIIGTATRVNYTNPGEPIDCLDIPTPDIVIENDSCGLGIGMATVSNNSDTLIYEWSNEVTDTQATNLSYGQYFLNVSNISGCSRNFYFFVDDPETPDIILPEFLTKEENEPITLIPTETTNMLTYLWSTGDTSPTIEVSNEGAYSVTITTAMGCEYVAETLVQESTPIDFSPCMTVSFPLNGSADDISGNDNHGTVFGATSTEGRKGRPESAYYFDGVDDYIEFPASAETQPESGLTFTAWFKSDNLPEDTWGTIVKNTGQGYELALNKIKNGGISSSLDLQSGSNFNINSRVNEYADDQWHSLAITYDSNSGVYRLFIDGNLNGESLGSTDTITYQTGTPFTIGRNGITNSNYFKGVIDDVKIFNCALNEGELSYLFTQQQNFDCYSEIYFEDFEGDIGDEWSDSSTTLFETNIDTTLFLGRYSELNTIIMSLDNLPTDRLLVFCMDFWTVDSWDGNGLTHGPDYFEISLDNERTLLRSSFAHIAGVQSYPGEYDTANLRINPAHTGSNFSGQVNNTSSNFLDARYRICRTFMNINDSLEIFFKSNTQGTNDEFWAIDNVSVLTAPLTLNTEEETVICNSDGSYIVSVPFTSNGDNTGYMAYEQGNTFGDIDTLFFTDDGTISSIEMPYPSGRDYNIVIAPAGDISDCYPVISGKTECTFNGACNLSASFTDECVGDSLVITGIIKGGTSPYSVYSDEYSTVLFPDNGNTFTFTIPSCFPQLIDFTITDFNMCEYTENTVVNTEFPVNQSSCLESIALYPNPVKSELNISFSEFCNNSNIKIYDSLGQLIRSDVLTGSSVSYDVSTLPKGVYFLYLDNEKNRHVEKFIKI